MYKWEKLNAVLKIVQDIARARREPIDELVKSRFPAMSRQEREQWLSKCKEIEDTAYDLARQVWDGKITRDDLDAKLRELFPDLTEERRSRTVSQAMYFAIK